MTNLDIIFPELCDGVLLGVADRSVLQRREHRRRHVHVIRLKPIILSINIASKTKQRHRQKTKLFLSVPWLDEHTSLFSVYKRGKLQKNQTSATDKIPWMLCGCEHSVP